MTKTPFLSSSEPFLNTPFLSSSEPFLNFRVQFQQKWGEREHIGGGGTLQVLQADSKHKHRQEMFIY